MPIPTSAGRRRLAPLALVLTTAALAAQGADWLAANYDKHEHRVPMRDGVLLFTQVYAPKDHAKPWPILMRRTPYGVTPYGADQMPKDLGPSPLFAEDRFIFVLQDVRGRWQSGGEFVDVRPHRAQKQKGEVDESSDTFDTIEWLLRNVPGHNGRVGMWGISYPGFYVSAGMIDAHPALRAASPQAPVADWFVGDDFRHNGALYLAHAFHFFYGFDRPRQGPGPQTWTPYPCGTQDGYRFFLELGALPNVNDRCFHGKVSFWNALLEHETWDEFWQARDLRPHLRRVAPAVLVVGGWFDAEDLFGPLETWRAIERQDPASDNRLVVGPWIHGGWARTDGDRLGDVRFGSKTAQHYREQVELPFFRQHLKDGGDAKLPVATMFETGANRWHQLDAWPPKAAVAESLYLRAGGALSFEPPAATDAECGTYVSDPKAPVPYQEAVAIGMTKEHMVADQRFASRRPDVLTFQTAPLAEELTLAGPVGVSLWVASSGTDSDFVVKLVDVLPDDAPDPDAPSAKPPTRMGGYQQLVRGEPFRAKFRESFTTPRPLVPDQATKLEFAMPDVFHRFGKGHRVMVQVQSSWFPLVARNPQKFCDVGRAADTDYVPATQRVFHAPATPSCLRVLALRYGK